MPIGFLSLLICSLMYQSWIMWFLFTGFASKAIPISESLPRASLSLNDRFLPPDDPPDDPPDFPTIDQPTATTVLPTTSATETVTTLATTSSRSSSSRLPSTSTDSLNSKITVSGSTQTSSTILQSVAVAQTSQALSPSTAESTIPGRKLLVLPIGLGVVAGLLGIIVLVILVTTVKRVKYRKQFRRRLLEESLLALAHPMAETEAVEDMVADVDHHDEGEERAMGVSRAHSLEGPKEEEIVEVARRVAFAYPSESTTTL